MFKNSRSLRNLEPVRGEAPCAPSATRASVLGPLSAATASGGCLRASVGPAGLSGVVGRKSRGQRAAAGRLPGRARGGERAAGCACSRSAGSSCSCVQTVQAWDGGVTAAPERVVSPGAEMRRLPFATPDPQGAGCPCSFIKFF